MNYGLASHILTERAAAARRLSVVPDPPAAAIDLPRRVVTPPLAEDAVVAAPRTDDKLRINATAVLGALGWREAPLTARIGSGGVVEVAPESDADAADVTTHALSADAQGRLVLSPTLRAHLGIAPRAQVLVVAYPSHQLLLLAGLAAGLSDLLRLAPLAPLGLPAPSGEEAAQPRGPRRARHGARR